MLRPPANPTGQLGLALWELALVTAVAAAIAAGAVAVGSSWQATANQLADTASLESRVGEVRHAVRTWYGGTYCRAEVGDRQRLGFPPTFPMQDTDAVTRDYPLEGQPRPGAGEGRLEWQISWPPSSRSPASRNPVGSSCAVRLAAKRQNSVPLRLDVFWSPSENHQPTSVIARRLDAWCDDDNNPQTAEACDGVPAGERLVWSSNLRERIDRDYERTRRYADWIREYGVNCDADGPDCDGDGRGDGDGVWDQRCASNLNPRFDADGNGQLDLDVNGDFAVDGSDWHLLGC